MLLIILLNVITLAAYEPLPNNDTSERNEFLVGLRRLTFPPPIILTSLSSPHPPPQDKTEYFFVVAFGVEMCLKVIALGFVNCGPNSYLKSPWNILDFIIVILGFVDIALASSGASVADVKALRAFRVLRPLRLITTVESLFMCPTTPTTFLPSPPTDLPPPPPTCSGLQVVLNSILRSLPALLDVAALLVFVLFVYAIIGMEFYQGRLNNRCFITVNNGEEGEGREGGWGAGVFVLKSAANTGFGDEFVRSQNDRLCSTGSHGYHVSLGSATVPAIVEV